ncbi:unnamed protein product [Blumeria hordei]|uniref:Uncharacterized protein n=2 Tax=Blumeria hordei TaxID=2867405 RepID=A0A383UVD1_BLUHO|nr:CSEP0413 putative effector protein [Blumeria hordei DH14]SZF03545.1 unnamed protein product [Blumeria hordei]
MDRITCVLALMTAIPGLTNQWNRVVMVADKFEQSYSVHYIPGGPRLPIPQNEEILVTPYKISNSGTSITAYCSLSLGLAQIIENVFPQASKPHEQPDLEFAKNKNDYGYCKKKIDELSKNSRSEVEMKDLGKDRCNNAIISQLALESKLRVTGMFGCFAPYKSAKVPTVLATDPVRLAKDVWEPIMSINDEEEPIKYVLAWFQGHLYVFQIYWGDTGYWQLVTPIGNEKNNGRVIYDFIFKNNSDLIKLTDSLKRTLRNHDNSMDPGPSNAQTKALTRKNFKSLPTLHSLKLISISGFLLCDAPEEP